MFSLVHYAFYTLRQFDFALTASIIFCGPFQQLHMRKPLLPTVLRGPVVDDSFEDVAEHKDSNGENILASERPGLR